MRNSNNIKWIRILIFTVFILSISYIYSNSTTDNHVVNALISHQPSNQQLINTTIFDLQSKLLNSIFNQVENSVVQITSKIPQSSTLNSTNANNGQNVTALGSGFIYDTKGHIITNNHVVGNSKIVDVTFVDGNRYTAKIIAKDPFSDIAVLKIVENLTKPIIPLKITNSSILKVGDPVIAIGNPYGLDNTMTTGIISQTGRVISESSNSIPDAIQTDAPINPGNSGGPLLNIKGQVIGINTAGMSNGVGFAISSNIINKELPTLIKNGNYTHSYLGLSGSTLTSDLTSHFKNISKSFRGVFISTIVKNASADKAGLRGMTIDYYGQKHGGDIITSINNQNMTKIDQLITYIDQHTKPGDTITLTVYRDGHYLHLKTKVMIRPDLQTTHNVVNQKHP
ncbi:MAG TPA: trypsin-like peptidase domain-containing protein [Verrucomicrobiae bacterium]|nr:trypsin-like peptidase domain-containing protein [Verrucomicrobiae bacterium]